MRIAVAESSHPGPDLHRVFRQAGGLHSLFDFSPARLAQLTETVPAARMCTAVKPTLEDPSIDSETPMRVGRMLEGSRLLLAMNGELVELEPTRSLAFSRG